MHWSSKFEQLFFVLQNYKKEFERAPTPAADIPAGFHKNPRGIELALKVSGKVG